MALRLMELTTTYCVNGKRETAISKINLQAREGEFIGVLGRSGAGKSTLIRSINQLARPSFGTVLWNGQDLTRLKGKKLRKATRDIGMIFQQFHLAPRLTVLQNCLIGCFGYRPLWKNAIGVITKEEKERAMAALQRVEMDHLAHKRVEQLSGGQQQRVAIARVMMQKPKLLLGDEPVASLDPVNTKQVMELIKETHARERMISIINLHDVRLALEYCDRIIGLFDGKLVFDGEPKDVDETVLSKIYGSS